MPFRRAVAEQLSELLAVLSHPHRIRIIEELRPGERNVNALSELLEISQSGASQHLAVLKNHKVVRERREGRMVFYSLAQPRVAEWLLDGISLLESMAAESAALERIAREARAAWNQPILPAAAAAEPAGRPAVDPAGESFDADTHPEFTIPADLEGGR